MPDIFQISDVNYQIPPRHTAAVPSYYFDRRSAPHTSLPVLTRLYWRNMMRGQLVPGHPGKGVCRLGQI